MCRNSLFFIEDQIFFEGSHGRVVFLSAWRVTVVPRIQLIPIETSQSLSFGMERRGSKAREPCISAGQTEHRSSSTEPRLPGGPQHWEPVTGREHPPTSQVASRLLPGFAVTSTCWNLRSSLTQIWTFLWSNYIFLLGQTHSLGNNSKMKCFTMTNLTILS